MTVALAFYKGKGNWIDWCIRTATRSKYSHVELIPYGRFNSTDIGYFCCSSSSRDGGVRCKNIKLSIENWDIVSVHWNGVFYTDTFKKYDKAKYDYVGILLSQILSLGRHDKRRWFCSEICAAYLGLATPHSYSPARLFETVRLLNHVHKNATEVGGRTS